MCVVVRVRNPIIPNLASNVRLFLNVNNTDATLVTILGMSVYSTYAYLPAYIYNVLAYFGYVEDS